MKMHLIILLRVSFFDHPRELVQSLVKVTLLLKHSVKLRPCILWRWDRHWVPKRRLLNFRRRGNSQKNTNYILNTRKVSKLQHHWL